MRSSIPIPWTSILRGEFTDDPAKVALRQWYAENGQFVATKFFGTKANSARRERSGGTAQRSRVPRVRAVLGYTGQEETVGRLGDICVESGHVVILEVQTERSIAR